MGVNADAVVCAFVEIEVDGTLAVLVWSEWANH
jgi:hypothetical protein